MTTVLLATLSIHFGLGFSAVHTPDQEVGTRAASYPRGLGLSLEAQAEAGSFYAAGTVLFAPMGSGTELASASARIGLFVLPTAISPYLAVGAGWLRQSLPDGDLPPNLLAADGAALIGEVGVAGLRDRDIGRVTAYVQIQQPLFDAPPDPLHSPPATKLVFLAGLRVFF